MRGLFRLVVLLAWVLASNAYSRPGYDGGGGTALHLPIRRSVRSTSTWKRGGQMTNIGIGDMSDVSYSVMVQVGETETPLVIDSGSADLWLASDHCGDSCVQAGLPLYPQAALTPAGQDVHLLYGDSRTGTHAVGPIGTDTVGIAGLSVPDQYFAAIIDTNTSVLESGSAGILGLGFPPISIIWRQLLATDLNWPVSPVSKRAAPFVPGGLNHSGYSPRHLPSFDFLDDIASSRKRQVSQQSFTSAIDSFATLGPLPTRLVTWSILSRPLVVTNLQRDTVSLSDHAGTLSLGALPFGLTDEQLTWVPVRGYSASEGGLPPPPEMPNEIYPLVWEIPLDDVYFNGMKLPRSILSPSSISLSALVDTGNSLIRGPQDVVAHISALLGDNFDCSVPHNLSFQIGGVQFPVDPRDFAHPVSIVQGIAAPNKVPQCAPALVATDPPNEGSFLYSWSLGDPFLKSALVAFYYGNMTHPSRDPPRVGFLSTVPSDAVSKLEDAVAAPINNGGLFPSTSEAAPHATPVQTMTLANAAPEVTQGSQRFASGARPARTALLDAASWASSLTVAVLVVGILGNMYR